MNDPSQEDALTRMIAVTHISSDSLAAVLLILEHLKRGIYTAEIAQTVLISDGGLPDTPSTEQDGGIS